MQLVCLNERLLYLQVKCLKVFIYFSLNSHLAHAITPTHKLNYSHFSRHKYTGKDFMIHFQYHLTPG